MDILFLHIFRYILSNHRIDFMVSGMNWFINLPQLIGFLVLFALSWAIIRVMCIAKMILPLHYFFVRVGRLLFILVCCGSVYF